MAVVIALDAGTTGVRALAIDESSRVVGWSYREFTQYFPHPGWVEHDATEIWESIQVVVAELAQELTEPVAAIGITNQRETVVAWDRRSGEPRHRAIVWQDRRTAEYCDQLEADGRLPLVRDRTGLMLDPYFTGTKARWLLTDGGVESDDDLAIGTIDSWLIWNLTGGASFVTEPSNACRTLLYDIDTHQWSDELAELLQVPIGALPDIRPTSGRFGVTAVGATALGGGVPISGVAGDQQAALFGQACFEPGMIKNTYGTGSFLLMNLGTERPAPVDGLLTTVAWDLGDGSPIYAYEGSIFVTGAAIQWLRDGLGIIDESPDVGPLAATVPDSGDVFLVPAFAGLGSPHWDPYARGTIVGLTRGSTAAHIARATVESMAYQVRDVVDLMTGASGQALTELRVDGGASAMDLLLQLQANQLGVTVTRPANQETTALGAAYLAGLAEGFWGSLDDVTDAWAVDLSVSPADDRSEADRLHRRWLQAVDRSKGWANS